MSKVIFTDVDGVLNSTQSMKKNNNERIFYGRNAYRNLDVLAKWELSYFDYEKIKLLKSIAISTGAEIVIISAIATSKYYPLIEEKLVEMGLPIVGVATSEYGRALAIEVYLMEHEVDDFIILDDDFFLDYDNSVDNLIRTNYYNEGLTAELAEEAVFKLQPKKRPSDF